MDHAQITATLEQLAGHFFVEGEHHGTFRLRRRGRRLARRDPTVYVDE